MYKQSEFLFFEWHSCHLETTCLAIALAAIDQRPQTLAALRVVTYADGTTIRRGRQIPFFPEGGNRNSLRQARDASLIRALFGHVSGGGRLLHQLERAKLRDMDDGGMRGLKFAGDERRCLGRCLVEAEYADCDRVPVSIVLNADRDQRLYELDIWKAAFAPLGEFPAFERVRTKA